MYKYLGNYNFEFNIDLDKLTYHSHKIDKHSDKNSNTAKEAGYGDNTEIHKVWGEDYPSELLEYVNRFPIKWVNTNFQVQKPGFIIPPHKDSFDMIKSLHNKKPYRILVCMSNWIFGQVIMVDKSVLTNWKKGDAWVWDSEAIHMSANGSLEDKLTMIISGFYEDI
jgi:hypothetical protein